MRKLSIRLALCYTGWQLRFAVWYSLRCRKVYLYQSARLFFQISQLTRRQKLLEQKLTTLEGGNAL